MYDSPIVIERQVHDAANHTALIEQIQEARKTLEKPLTRYNRRPRFVSHLYQSWREPSHVIDNKQRRGHRPCVRLGRCSEQPRAKQTR